MGRPLGAQGAVIDAGLSIVSFPEDKTTVFGPSLRVTMAGERGSLFGMASGSGVATLGAASGSATLLGGARTYFTNYWLGELAGELTSVTGSGTNQGAGTALLTARSVWGVERGGVWLKSTAHQSGRTNSTLTGLGVESGAWWKTTTTQVAATLTQQWTRAELYTGAFRRGYSGTAPVRYTEAGVSVHRESNWATLDVLASTRRDPEAAHLFEQSYSATAALWGSDRSAFLISASHSLPDFVRGADAADAVSFGIRMRQPRPALERAARLIVVVQVSDTTAGRVLRVRAHGARSVEVMGDFTEWETRLLTRSGEGFECPVTMPAGSHRILVRVDGGEWRPAANTPAVDDDLGGRVGLLVVP
ncbi:MAG: hypothetical protein JWM95_5266 [Gemmatimonadetes bacterium]|nr:hypothetical protein [Gemmatimonadota bacterium]